LSRPLLHRRRFVPSLLRGWGWGLDAGLLLPRPWLTGEPRVVPGKAVLPALATLRPAWVPGRRVARIPGRRVAGIPSGRSSAVAYVPSGDGGSSRVAALSALRVFFVPAVWYSFFWFKNC
jgi:hypothetical protein